MAFSRYTLIAVGPTTYSAYIYQLARTVLTSHRMYANQPPPPARALRTTRPELTALPVPTAWSESTSQPEPKPTAQLEPEHAARRPPNPGASPRPRRLRVVCISDTHNRHSSLVVPAGDVLVHAGDLTNGGSRPELARAVAWLAAQPHEIKLVVAGNHDGRTLDPAFGSRGARGADPAAHAPSLALLTSPTAVAAGIVYLAHEARLLTLRDGRRIRVFASPLSPQDDADSAWSGFGYAPPESADTSPWAVVPADTELLVTHTPPKYHLDAAVSYACVAGAPAAGDVAGAAGMAGTQGAEGAEGIFRGCEMLRRALWHVRPALHVFGHVHRGWGVERVTWADSTPSGCPPRPLAVETAKGLGPMKFGEERLLRVEDPAPLRARKMFLIDTVRVLGNGSGSEGDCGGGCGGGSGEGNVGGNRAGRGRAGGGGGRVAVSVQRGRETLCVNASIVRGPWIPGIGHPPDLCKPVVVDLAVDAGQG